MMVYTWDSDTSFSFSAFPTEEMAFESARYTLRQNWKNDAGVEIRTIIGGIGSVCGKVEAIDENSATVDEIEIRRHNLVTEKKPAIKTDYHFCPKCRRPWIHRNGISVFAFKRNRNATTAICWDCDKPEKASERR